MTLHATCSDLNSSSRTPKSLLNIAPLFFNHFTKCQHQASFHEKQKDNTYKIEEASGMTTAPFPDRSTHRNKTQSTSLKLAEKLVPKPRHNEAFQFPPPQACLKRTTCYAFLSFKWQLWQSTNKFKRKELHRWNAMVNVRKQKLTGGQLRPS